jgi:uncharacterized protein (DUF488 family)
VKRSSPPVEEETRPVLYTIGHSTHAIERFVELLAEHQVAVLADVRSFPGSRRWPQFNQAELACSLAQAGVEYRWFKLLGGRRHSVRPDSPHTGWTHPAFRSYADYTESAEFEAGLAELIAVATCVEIAIMCSEGLWWRCHRRIISDQMTVRGWQVMHIMPDGQLKPHSIPEFAQIIEGRLIYSGKPSRVHPRT